MGTRIAEKMRLRIQAVWLVLRSASPMPVSPFDQKSQPEVI
jgi:hypothetical protein